MFIGADEKKQSKKSLMPRNSRHKKGFTVLTFSFIYIIFIITMTKLVVGSYILCNMPVPNLEPVAPSSIAIASTGRHCTQQPHTALQSPGMVAMRNTY